MSKTPQPSKTVSVFYSYSHKDEKLRGTLQEHITSLKREEIISDWHDRRIIAGSEWAGEIDEHLKSADIILLLVSSSFIASNYCYDVEMELAMKRHEAGEALIVPIILRPCDLKGVTFGNLQSLPKNRRAVTKWSNRDDAFTDIANGIRLIAEELKAKRREINNAHSDADKSANVADPASYKPNVAKHGAALLIPRTPIVGFVARRDEQGRDIVKLLIEELAPEKNQLVALWGPGGAGKTTLAAEVVRALEKSFKGRVVWASAWRRIDFGLSMLLDEIATQLNYEELRKLLPEAKATQVASLAGENPTLVVLDNFETIAEEEQSRCLEFLAQKVTCTALLTTRASVKRDDVYNVALASMELEEAREFLSRLIKRTRKPSNFDKLDCDELIGKCDSNPLILQWVVGRVDLAYRPKDVFDYLSRGEGEAAERIFTRSLNLPYLGDDGRDTILALALFTPSASRDALAEVAGFGENVRRLDSAVENLSALWLVETTEGNERLYLRGLTRELAKSRLSKDARADEFLKRHVARFLRHAEAHTQETLEDMDTLEAEKDNISSAMKASLEMKDLQSAVRIQGAISSLLFVRGYWDEGVKSGEEAQALAREMKDERQIALTLRRLARFYISRGDNAEGGIREALEIFRNSGDEESAASCLHNLALVAQNRGELDEARRLYDESLGISKHLGNQSGVATTLHNLAMLAQSQGEFAKAQQLYDESLVIRKLLNSRSDVASTLHQLAILAQAQGEFDEARRLYDESLNISKRLGNQSVTAATLGQMGRLAELKGDKAEAARLYREALSIFERLRSPFAEIARQSLSKVEGERS